jgi:hypothetical protein
MATYGKNVEAERAWYFLLILKFSITTPKLGCGVISGTYLFIKGLLT